MFPACLHTEIQITAWRSSHSSSTIPRIVSPTSTHCGLALLLVVLAAELPAPSTAQATTLSFESITQTNSVELCNTTKSLLNNVCSPALACPAGLACTVMAT